MDNNNWMKQLLMLGLGTTSVVADKVREVSDHVWRCVEYNPGLGTSLATNQFDF
ncbi:MAG: hypothetical protein F6K28_11660 [Microcoleus sp. SIO2G3]|nr:hypothetical protein [Microcoleus sp. SIO2G3]